MGRFETEEEEKLLCCAIGEEDKNVSFVMGLEHGNIYTTK